MSFASRLQQLVDERSGGNAAEFSRFCGVQDSSIRQYLKGTKPSLDNLIAIASATSTSMDWLATGRGQKSSADTQDSSAKGKVLVPRLHLTASAGPGSINDGQSEIDAIEIPHWILSRLGLKAQNARILSASGLSMLPTIGDGDLLLVDVSKERRDPIDGLIYVLSIDDSLFVKRLRRSPGGWVLVSDNRALYDEEPIPAGCSVEIHGQVMWVDRKLS